MKIAKFNTLTEAENKLSSYNTLAGLSENEYTTTLANIQKHTTLDIWWFNFTSCINNGGLGKDQIAADEPNLIIQEFNSYQDFVDNGYLPQPSL